ncbi:MAG: DUF2442 domain-containing protein [Oscillospiraceae bacterium]|nr:DUF2442 domain-containing protein [Oscillospiraceae bacterium]
MSAHIIHGEPLPPRVVSVSPDMNYKLQLAFDNGERRVFNAKPLLSLKIFEPLKNKQFFNMVQVAHGSILWPNDIDYCPDTLYLESVPCK